MLIEGIWVLHVQKILIFFKICFVDALPASTGL